MGYFRYLSFFNKTEPLSRTRTSGSIDADRDYIVVGDALADNAEDLSDIDTNGKVKSREPSASQNESIHDKTKTLQNKCIAFIEQIEKG